MRKLLIAVVLIALVALPGFTLGLEFGVSGTMSLSDISGNSEEGSPPIPGFHIGVIPWAILYASWDSLVMSPDAIYGLTGKYLPGFLNLFDAGLRLDLKKVIFFLEAGINNTWVYGQGTDDANGLGANLRVGLGLKFNWWGITVVGTSVFADFGTMVNVLKGLADDQTRDWSVQKLLGGLYPSLMAVIYI